MHRQEKASERARELADNITLKKDSKHSFLFATSGGETFAESINSNLHETSREHITIPP